MSLAVIVTGELHPRLLKCEPTSRPTCRCSYSNTLQSASFDQQLFLLSCSPLKFNPIYIQWATSPTLGCRDSTVDSYLSLELSGLREKKRREKRRKALEPTYDQNFRER
ncbi:hypothetical protein P5673_003373 [Acropora cervicornis]|uniref:Uncharacterized protein n=1 Tax=Acropora cervicornis TaxID=6130 RepID=A0AAD9R399_ACRCE|nr:hypothetical protein P5673_003373 [Acropora cervicornis]